MSATKIKLFEGINLTKIEEEVNEYMFENPDVFYDAKLTTSVVKDDEGLDVMIYTILVKTIDE